MNFFLHTSRAYVRSIAAAIFIFVFILAVDSLLEKWGMRIEATYLDELLVAIAVGLLVLAIESRHEAELRAQKELTMLLLGLNHYVRSALQSIESVRSTVADERQSRVLADAAKRIDWIVREVSMQILPKDVVGDHHTSPGNTMNSV